MSSPPTPAANDGTLPAGTVLGPWRLEAPIASGGFGDVYRARDKLTGTRRAAVKVLQQHRQLASDFRDRFLQEIALLSQIESPNIVRLYDADVTEDGVVWMAMELLEGKTLAAILREGPRLSIPDILKILGDVADGVQAAHMLGVIHRDLKPDNIFITTKGVAKVLDFGIAKLDDPDGVALVNSTEEQRVLGTTPYMSPERLQGGRVDLRCDVFALGIIGYESFTGRHPFAEADGTFVGQFQLMASIMVREPGGPRDPASQPEGVDSNGRPYDGRWDGAPYAAWLLVKRAMAKAPRDRHASMAEVKREILAVRAAYLVDHGLSELALERVITSSPGDASLALVASREPPPVEPQDTTTSQMVRAAPTAKAAPAAAAAARPAEAAGSTRAGQPALARESLPSLPSATTPEASAGDEASPANPTAAPRTAFAGHGTVPMAHVTPAMLGRQAARRAGKPGTMRMSIPSPEPSQVVAVPAAAVRAAPGRPPMESAPARITLEPSLGDATPMPAPVEARNARIRVALIAVVILACAVTLAVAMQSVWSPRAAGPSHAASGSTASADSTSATPAPAADESSPVPTSAPAAPTATAASAPTATAAVPKISPSTAPRGTSTARPAAAAPRPSHSGVVLVE
jgi:serine/threonine-protein kinase